MFEANSYFDLNISEHCTDKHKTLTTLYEYGFRTVAINQVINEEDTTANKKKKKDQGNNDIVPPPIEVKISKEYANMKILSRLTIIFSNQETIYKIIKSPNFKKYDIIAVAPISQQALAFLGSSFEADIITFEADTKSFPKFTRKIYNNLVEKGYYFELMYSPAIIDVTHRKNIIHVAHLYHAIGKMKNVIITSGLSVYMLARSPYDIINLGLIFGLSQQLSRDAISNIAKKLYLSSVGRRHGKTIMFVEDLSLVEDESIITLDDTMDDEDIIQPTKKLKQ